MKIQAWKCYDCGNVGVIEIEEFDDVWLLMDKAARDHDDFARNCKPGFQANILPLQKPHGAPAGFSGIICIRRPRRPSCAYCSRPFVILCDYPDEHRPLKKPVKRADGSIRRFSDCNAKLCERHAKQGKTPDYHFCPKHFALARAAYERRAAKNQEV